MFETIIVTFFELGVFQTPSCGPANIVGRQQNNIGKRLVHFLLVLIELFSLGVTAKALRASIGSKSAISLQQGPVDPKFQVEGVAPINHSSQKTRLNDLSYGIKIWTDLYSVF